MKTYKISYTSVTNYPKREVKSVIVTATDKSTATTKAQREGNFHWSQIVGATEVKQYKIKILTSKGPVTIIYTDTEPMEQFESKLKNQYGNFIQVYAIPVNN